MAQFVKGKPVTESGGFVGQRAVIAKLKEIMDATTAREVKQVYYEAGSIVRDQARANAPRSTTRTKGTHLADAIFVSWGKDNAPDVLVGVNYDKAPHAHWVEYGNARMQARPYLRPAISQTFTRVSEHIKNGLLGVIGKAAK